MGANVVKLKKETFFLATKQHRSQGTALLSRESRRRNRTLETKLLHHASSNVSRGQHIVFQASWFLNQLATTS